MRPSLAVRIAAPTFARLCTLAAFALLCLPAMSDTTDAPAPTDDPFLWLEDVQGPRALDWVRERNAHSGKLLESQPGFAALRSTLRAVLDEKQRIPYFTRKGDQLYNFWQDESHKRGLWRRTTLAEYRKPQPAWETVIDLDALGAAEKENWVWGGANCLGPQSRRCLVSMSRGGADAKVIREFDTVTKTFVTDGFTLPEAKSDVSWVDADTVLVGTDFGPGALTDSGYPRVIKRWKRGTPLAQASTVFEAQSADVYASAVVDRTPGFERTWLMRATDFYHQEWSLLDGEKLVRLDVPTDAQVGFMHSAGAVGDTLLLELRSDLNVQGRSYPRGALLAADLPAYLKGERRFTVLFEPTPTRSLAGYTTTRTHVVLDILDNVTSRLEEWRRDGTRFTRRPIAAPTPGTLSVGALHDPMLRDDPLAEQYTLNYADFLTPDTLLLGRTGSDQRATLKSLPPTFDAAGLKATQHIATSRDGTKVPYFVVGPAQLKHDAANPTMLYGYGGYRISLAPWYPRGWGPAWLAKGGVFVVANIRGGGEFGPAWHDAAVKANKQKSYDDFIAVAEDLIARKVTSPRHLGIQGGSNGGLLVGAVAIQRPDLFNAVVCQVPLLDMRRFHKLLAGASWMAEYGNPDDPDEWAFISKYSPYQNVKPQGHYPRMLLTTSTRDDRVHPGHARKMAARLLSQGHEVLYYENIEGGHGLAADNEQRAHVLALEFSYAWMQLGR